MGIGNTETICYFPAFRSSILTCVACFTIFCVFIPSRTSVLIPEGKYSEYKIYRVIPTTEDHLWFLTNIVDSRSEQPLLDVLSADIVLQQKVNLMVSKSVEESFTSSCDDINLPFVVAWENMQELIDRQKIAHNLSYDNSNVTGHSMTWTSYHRYQTMEEHFQYLASAYPQLVNLEKLGMTYEGHNIWLLKLGKPRNNGRRKPAIWMDAGIHAREWIASATMTFIINELVTSYETNDISRRLLDSLDWYIVPLINVDGFEYTHTHDRVWRKTRRMSTVTTCVGVDPNRNYDFKWQTVKPSHGACANTFAGPHPYSEPENLAVFEKVMDLRWDLKAFLTLHCHGQLWLLPYACTDNKPHDYADLYALAVNATQALKQVYGTRYRVGTSADVLYTSSGTSQDWAKGRTPIKYVYTIELRDTGKFEFLLPPEQIIPTGFETFEAVKVIAQRVIDEFN